MRNFNRFTFTMCSIITLTACTTGPTDKFSDPNKIDSLSTAVECELREAFGVTDITGVQANDPKRPIDPDSWTVSYSITETSQLVGTASVDALKWIVPANVDRLLIGGDASISQSREMSGKVQINMNLIHLHDLKCDDPQKARLTPKSKYDIAKWINQIMHITGKGETIAVGKADKKNSDKVKTFGYTVTVVTDGNIGAGPDFANGKFVTLGTLRAENKSTEIVDFAFSEVEEPGPQDVRVTNFPSTIPPGPAPPKKATGPVLGNVKPSENLRQMLKSNPYRIPAFNLQRNNDTIYQLQNEGNRSDPRRN
ncbi:hypothetical protein AB4Z52_32315 [Rhizobium sp. 2YAF20]|uniref:hypothetical protein n=1 Tax=Rhizobium sp. 2YAF20 TaxID=3233027 RepID=UPI003F948D68